MTRGRVCNLLFQFAVTLRFQVPQNSWPDLTVSFETIFYSLIQDSPNQEGQVPVFISPRNRVAQIFPRALGSLFVASYDSQSYGGSTVTRLHTGIYFLKYSAAVLCCDIHLLLGNDQYS
jgi:hypothetical protein